MLLDECSLVERFLIERSLDKLIYFVLEEILVELNQVKDQSKH